MFEDRTTEKLKEETLAAIAPEAGISTMSGSYADGVVGPLCREVSQVYQSLPAVLSMLFVDESSGRFLDLVGRDYHNLTRREGTRARCGVTLTGKAGTVIPAGTVFLTGTGLQLLLMEGVVLGSGGTAAGRLEAAEAGSAYNIAPGSLTGMFVNLPGLEGYVNTQGEGGTDRESDAALYARIDEARKRPRTSGNGWDYRGWAMEVAGTGEAKVVELPTGPGTVGITVTDSSFEGASPEMVEAVKDSIRARRPVGASVSVEAAGELEVSVIAAVTLSGTSAPQVQEELERRLRDYFRELVRQKFGTIYYGPEADLPYTLYYNRVLALLLTIEGVQTFSTLTINDGTADVSIPAGSVPKLKEVHVT